jgi:hypothetical protein
VPQLEYTLLSIFELDEWACPKNMAPKRLHDSAQWRNQMPVLTIGVEDIDEALKKMKVKAVLKCRAKWKFQIWE